MQESEDNTREEVALWSDEMRKDDVQKNTDQTPIPHPENCSCSQCQWLYEIPL